MAGELIWSRAALDDIEAIAAFIARDSRIHARRVVEAIFASCERRLAQTNKGSLIPDKPSDLILEQSLYGYRILFERQGDDLHMLAVTHGHRLTASLSGASPEAVNARRDR